MGPTSKRKKKTKAKTKWNVWNEQKGRWKGEKIFDFFFSLVISQIYENLTVGFRHAKNENVLRNEGYAWVPKTQDFT